MPRPSTLSVYLPTYNHAALLAGAVEALMSQSHSPDEIVIIDDASTDDTPAVINQLRARYPRLRVIRNATNQGIANIMQWIPAQLRGDYMYGAASDDRVLPGFFASALGLAELHPQAGVIFGQIPTYDTRGNYLYTSGIIHWKTSRLATPEEFLRDCLDAELAAHSLSGATIYRRQALIDIGGFRPELGSWLDTFAIRALGLTHGVCYLAQPCMAWRLSAHSVSQSAARSPRALWQTINRAAALMRSPAFRHLFPEEHVRRWLHGYRFIIAEQYLLSRLGPSITHRAARSPWLRRVRLRTHYWINRTASRGAPKADARTQARSS